MPVTEEPLAIWLVSALAIACIVALSAAAESVTSGTHSVLLLALAAVIASGGLLATRSRVRQEITIDVHRRRPAPEQLIAEYLGDGSSYVVGMSGWVEAVRELLDHAIEASGDAPSDDLIDARGDTAMLAELLHNACEDHPEVIAMTRLHAACRLWELDEPRCEGLAAEIAPDYHRRWRARAIVARRLRHGGC